MAFRSLITMFFLTLGPCLSFAQEEERIDELLLEQIQEELGEHVDISEISLHLSAMPFMTSIFLSIGMGLFPVMFMHVFSFIEYFLLFFYFWV